MKKIGRPTKLPPKGFRASLGLKVTRGLKQRLEAAAAKSGRTQSQEAEFRIEQSFRDEHIIGLLRAELVPDQNTLHLTGADFKKFERLLAAPTMRNDKLMALLRGVTVFSQTSDGKARP